MPALKVVAPATAPTFDVPLFRVHLWLRLLFLAQAWGFAVLTAPAAAHPRGVVLVVTFMLLWTLGTSAVYVRRRGTAWVVVVDVAVTLAVVLLTVPVRGAAEAGVGMTLAGYWIVGAPLAAAVRFGLAGGLAAAAVLVVPAWLISPRHDAETWGSTLVVVVACGGLGYLVEQIRDAGAERDTYYATAAAMGERERLSRIVHDGVLQVLAMVEREGDQFGPRGERLAAEARRQELQLRALLQDRDVDVTVGEVVDTSRKSLTSALDRHASATVSIAMLADDVRMPAATVDELDAVVTEVLTNVAKHAGPRARAFLLLEAEGDELILSIRDNGLGAAAAQIEGAGARGRLGVQDSIHGRIRDLGGTAVLTAAPGRGVEWEFRVPRGQQ